MPVTSYAEALLADPLEKSSLPAKEQIIPLGTAVTGAGNVTPIAGKADMPQKMSCWQYGKLIFEHNVIPSKEKMANIRLLQNPETGVKMQFFDFKTAFCLIK